MLDPRVFLRSLFDAAINAADPARCVPPNLPERPRGRTIVVGAGKAAASMAKAVEEHWQGDLSGVVVTRYGHAVPTSRIVVREAAHPNPDQAGLAAASEILALVSDLTADDLVLCLISGGGSALLPLPAAGLTLQIKQDINKALLRSGARIADINCVRRHLSQIKGGKLAAACYPAKVVTLVISDVPGDNPLDIASGPTVGDPTTCADALDVLRRYDIEVCEDCLQVLSNGHSETIKPGDERLSRCETRLIATPQMALEAAAGLARASGIAAHILGDAIEGEARDVGRVMAGIALQIARRDQPFSRPCVLLSGGETTVTVRGTGRGGRNVEFLLGMTAALDGCEGVHALAGDTDGIDGIEEIAGAYISPSTITRSLAKGVSFADSLGQNNGHGFFEALGDSVITGPTLTNVNDFRAILVTD